MASESSKRKKSYDLQYKLDAVEFAEMNSNEKAAQMFLLLQHIVFFIKRYLPLVNQQWGRQSITVIRYKSEIILWNSYGIPSRDNLMQ